MGLDRFSAGLDGYKALLDGTDHESGLNLNAGAARRFGDYEGLAERARRQARHEDDDLSLLDAKRYLAGLSVTRLNLFDGKARAGATLFAGTDDTNQADSPYGNDRRGARLFGSWALRTDSTIYAELSGMTTDYDGTRSSAAAARMSSTASPSPSTCRTFPQTSGASRPRLRYLENDSNISLYEYDRFEAVVFIRRDF